MEWGSGHKKNLLIIIPARKLNLIIQSNVEIIWDRLRDNYSIKICVVTNEIHDSNQSELFELIYNPVPNKASSVNKCLAQTSYSGAGVVIYLDDDIVLSKEGLSSLIKFVELSPARCVCSPYDTGHIRLKDVKFNFLTRIFYSKLLRTKVRSYKDIQGKSIYNFGFPALFKNEPNYVEWIPGPFMIFKNLGRDEIFFDSEIFKEHYLMEDYFLSYSLYKKRYPVIVLPVVFEHVLLYDKKKSNLRVTYKTTIITETIRYKIQSRFNLRIRFFNLKYKTVVFLMYLNRMKSLKLKDIIAFLASVVVLVYPTNKFYAK